MSPNELETLHDWLGYAEAMFSADSPSAQYVRATIERLGAGYKVPEENRQLIHELLVEMADVRLPKRYPFENETT